MVLEEFITTITFWMPVLLVYLLQSTSAITRKDPLLERLLKFMRMNFIIQFFCSDTYVCTELNHIPEFIHIFLCKGTSSSIVQLPESCGSHVETKDSITEYSVYYTRICENATDTSKMLQIKKLLIFNTEKTVCISLTAQFLPLM
jgi:hypothetical protein